MVVAVVQHQTAKIRVFLKKKAGKRLALQFSYQRNW